MSILCKIGKHKWQGCKCEKCGAVRDSNHEFWNNSANSWGGRRSCTCRICGKVKDADHYWIGCTCRDCGKIRDEQHDYKNGICTLCGKKICVDLANMSEKDRALLIFNSKYSKSDRMEALDSVSMDAAAAAFTSFPGDIQERYTRDDAVANAFLDRLPQDSLKEFVSSGYWSASVKVEDNDFLVQECIKANRVSDYILKLRSDRKQAILQALLETPDMRKKACVAMGGHQRDKNCKCMRCGTVVHDWKLITGYRNTEIETYRCRYCGLEESYQVNT